MEKEEYLKELSRLLRSLSDEERKKILEFYREIIEDKMENGEAEEQAVKDLGDVRILAQKILSENPNREGFKTHRAFWSSGESVGKTYSILADGITSVILEAENQAISIVPSDTDEITVDYMESPGDNYSFFNEDGVFRMKHTESGRFRTVMIHWSGDETEKILVKVPASYRGDFSVNTTNSYIKIRNFSHIGSLKCKTANSAIHLEEIFAKIIDCKTQNAVIKLKDVTASENLSADTENAAIKLESISAPVVSLETQNALIKGTVSGRREDYTVEARTSNAICNLQSGGSGPKKLKVRTSNAIIHISFQ